ncbi:MAG TPA: hypothetical protein VF071_06200 [Candidatus Limnocylindria bacterium]
MRILAWLLAAYAVLGAILMVAALLIGGPLVSRLDRVTTSALDTMASATEATRVAADAFEGFDVSIAEARASTDDAAGLTRETAVTLDALGAAMGISLFGAQPLLPLADQFERSAGQMRQLGDNLEGIGEALDNNRADVAEVGTQMRILANRLETFEGRITAERLGGGVPLSWLFYGFLAWQVLPILAAAVGAAWIFRNTRSVVGAPPLPPAGS